MRTTTELPAGCPYCGAEAGQSEESRWYTDTLLEIHHRCDHCGQAWREEWVFRLAGLAETAEEHHELEFGFRHPEC